MLVKMIALEPHDGRQPGQDFEVSERQAAALHAKRLAKMAVPVANKMAQPHDNKALRRNPSPAAGEVRPSSASPVAQASQPTTASTLDAGEPATQPTAQQPRRRGRPTNAERAARDASS